MHERDAEKSTAERPERTRGAGDGIAEAAGVERQTGTARQENAGEGAPKLMEEVLRR